MRHLIPIVLSALIPAASAGPLTPPPGPPASTFRTLDQVEPRTAVNDLPSTPSAQHAIGLPGSYYLTGNITNTTTTAIEVQTSGVVIDLNGFTIDGAFFGGSLIRVDAPTGIVTIRNGTIRRAQGLTIDLLNTTNTRVVLEDIAFEDSVGGVEIGTGGSVERCQFIALIGGTPVIVAERHASVRDTLIENSAGMVLGDNAIVERVRMRGIAGNAIDADADALIRHINIEDATGRGINTFGRGIVENCVVHDAGEEGIVIVSGGRVVGCTVSSCGGIGISAVAGVVVECVSVSNGLDGFGLALASVAVGSVAVDNLGNGFAVNSNVILKGCAAYSNTRAGISSITSITVLDCSAGLNFLTGIEVGAGSLVRDSVAFDNGLDGISAGSGSLVESCVARENGTHGIRVTSECTVRFCNATDNGQNSGTGAGIRTTGVDNLIEANSVVGNDRGIEFVSNSSVAIQNRARNNTINYVNINQPTADPFLLGTASPWANLDQ